jgi:hypothetical protein
MLDLSFHEYALRYMLIPGQNCTTQDVMQAVSLPTDLPLPLKHLFQCADQIDYRHIVINEEDPILKQWNPYSGAAPLMNAHHLASQLNEDHRWLIQSFEKSTTVLYHLLHESAHGMMAMIGQMGLLSLLNPSEQMRFHCLSEACAILVSDLIGHAYLRSESYFERFWPSSTGRTHAVQLSPLEALHHAGITFTPMIDSQSWQQVQSKFHDSSTMSQLDITSRQMVDKWLFNLYLHHQHELPLLPLKEPLRAVALAFLYEESSYANKIASTVNPAWYKHYWSRTAIQRYLQDFIPACPVQIPHSTIVLKSIEDCQKHWLACTLNFPLLTESESSYVQMRLTVQRRALKCCELIDTIQSHRVLADSFDLKQALTLLQSFRQTLKRSFDQSTIQPFSQIKSSIAEEFLAEIDSKWLELLEHIATILSPCITMVHPYMEHINFMENLPVFKPNLHYEPHEIHGILNFICKESKASYQHRAIFDAHDPLRAQMQETYEWSYEMLGQLNLSGMNDHLQKKINQELTALYKHRRLYLSYPLHWAHHAPFVEPLVGFRYQ